MSEAELDGLERDVVEARQRLNHDLDKLRAPTTAQRVRAELTGYKDELVDQMVERGKEKIRDVVDDLKQRAVANPAAVLSIGAGIAWHLLRRPPITSVLIGLGLVNLFRTPPALPHTDVRDRLRQQASAAAQYAGEIGQDIGARIAGAVQTGVDQALEAGSVAAGRVSDVAGRAFAGASTAADRVVPEIEKARDQVLLGAAALSVTAAVAVVVARNTKEHAE